MSATDLTNLRRLALIPARGGSKRIHRKNIVDFFGRPILGYPLEAAQRSNLFDLIHLSTDDDEIASIGKSLGADVRFRRPPNLADDFTPLLPVARWVIEKFDELRILFDDIFILFPCAPLLEPEDLHRAYDIYLQHRRQHNLLTVCRCPGHYERYYRRAQDGRLTPIVSGGSFIRSQDLESAYFETGTFTIFSREWLLSSRTLADDTNYISLELPPWKSADIDTLEDLEFAKLLFQHAQNRKKAHKSN